MSESSIVSAILQVALTVLPIALLMERRISKLEVKVDLIWKLVSGGDPKRR